MWDNQIAKRHKAKKTAHNKNMKTRAKAIIANLEVKTVETKLMFKILSFNLLMSAHFKGHKMDKIPK